MAFQSPKDMLAWQWRSILEELNELQRHASDPSCPCLQSDKGEYCLHKHSLGLHTLAKETGSMAPDHADMLADLAHEALEQHNALKDRITCGKFHKDEKDTVEWSRAWRKKIEPIYYACGVKTEAKREKAKVADPGHTLTADNVISHVRFEPNREKVVAAYIGPKRQVLGVNTVATGTAHSAPLPVDKVVREANAHQAKGIVLMHNHPSGTTEISQDDKDATRILREAASPLWVEHHIQGDTVAKVAEGSPATDITIRGQCKGKPSTCSIAVKGSEVVTKNAPSPASLKRTIEEVEADMKARRGVPPNPNTFAIGPSLTKYQFRFEVPGMKEVAVFGSKDRVFTVTMPGQTVEASELLGGKQYVTAGHIHQAGEQPKLFERNPNPTITIAGRCKGTAGCKLTVKATEAIAAGATPGDLTKAIAQVQRRWSEESGPGLARVAEPTRCRVVHQHDDGDQTLRCKEGTFVKTTDGKIFKEAKVNEQPDWNHLHDQGWELRQLIKVGNDVLVVEQPYEPALPSISPILNDVTDILSEIYRPPIGMNEYCVVKPFTHPTQIMGKRGDILTGKQRFDLSIHFRFSVRGKPGKQIEPHALTERVREPNVRDPLLAAVVSKACGLGLCVAEPKGKK